MQPEFVFSPNAGIWKQASCWRRCTLVTPTQLRSATERTLTRYVREIGRAVCAWTARTDGAGDLEGWGFWSGLKCLLCLGALKMFQRKTGEVGGISHTGCLKFVAFCSVQTKWEWGVQVWARAAAPRVREAEVLLPGAGACGAPSTALPAWWWNRAGLLVIYICPRGQSLFKTEIPTKDSFLLASACAVIPGGF